MEDLLLERSRASDARYAEDVHKYSTRNMAYVLAARLLLTADLPPLSDPHTLDLIRLAMGPAPHADAETAAERVFVARLAAYVRQRRAPNDYAFARDADWSAWVETMP